MSYSLIYSIVPKNCGELITHAANEAGAGGGSVLMGKGTASNSILQLLGFGDSAKDISLNIVDDEICSSVIDAVKKVAEKKPHFGVLFSTRVTHFSKTNSDSTGDTNMNADYQLITAIVNKGYAEDAMAAARKAGAGGGTIIGARGTTFFGMEIVPEKDLLMILVPSNKASEISDAIQNLPCLSKKGSGIVFTTPAENFTILGK